VKKSARAAAAFAFCSLLLLTWAVPARGCLFGRRRCCAPQAEVGGALALMYCDGVWRFPDPNNPYEMQHSVWRPQSDYGHTCGYDRACAPPPECIVPQVLLYCDPQTGVWRTPNTAEEVQNSVVRPASDWGRPCPGFARPLKPPPDGGKAP
jgi:hypothetical protein